MSTRADLARRCETIEQAYEFMLAYAAQGLPGDAGSQTGGQLRELLSQAVEALRRLPVEYSEFIHPEHVPTARQLEAFLRVLDRDAGDALAAIELVLAQRSISSQLVDNLNASIHLRALLTDLFLIDEVLKGLGEAASGAPNS